MCLVIAFITTIYAFTAFYNGHFTSASIAAVIALFFTLLLARNIRDVRKRKNEKNTDIMKEET